MIDEDIYFIWSKGWMTGILYRSHYMSNCLANLNKMKEKYPDCDMYLFVNGFTYHEIDEFGRYYEYYVNGHESDVKIED